MIYPENFELKIGFTEVRSMLRERCLSSLGKSQVDEMTFSFVALLTQFIGLYRYFIPTIRSKE